MLPGCGEMIKRRLSALSHLRSVCSGLNSVDKNFVRLFVIRPSMLRTIESVEIAEEFCKLLIGPPPWNFNMVTSHAVFLKYPKFGARIAHIEFYEVATFLFCFFSYI